jgi:glycosyltransferase involved in cell wall biosynthesis
MSPPPPPLHILMTTDAVGGVWTFATGLAERLCAGGDSVTLVTLGPQPTREQLGVLRGCDRLNIEITDLALEWIDPEGHDVARARHRLAQFAQRLQPDVVHLNGYREACGEWAAPVVVTAHSDVRSWWHACRGHDPDEPRWQAYANNVEAGLRAAGAWTAPTASYCNTVDTLFAPPTRGRVIRNGTDTCVTGMAKEPYILAAGRLWDEAKNLSALLATVPGVDWPLQIAGPLQPSDGARPAVVHSRVTWLGALPHDDLLAHMRRAAIFAAPALYEPFGLTVLEAAAAGCALLLSDIPTFRELWDGAALFVDPREPAAVRNGLQRLCGDAPARGQLQASARRRARRYTLTETAAHYRATYCAILEQPLLARGHALAELRA